MSNWDGKEQRTANITLNDILLELREMKQEVKGDMKLLHERFENHAKADDTTFKAFTLSLTEVITTVGWLQKGFFLVIGAYILFQVLVQVHIISFDKHIPDSNDNSSYSSSDDSAYVGRHPNFKGKGSMDRRSNSRD